MEHLKGDGTTKIQSLLMSVQENVIWKEKDQS